jgi:predicted nuclease of predicted toxin-antitoxin system
MEASPGLADDDVLRMANTNTMLLLTADKDFGEIVFRRRLIAL